MQEQGFLSRRRNVIIGGSLVLLALGILTAGNEAAGPVGRTVGILGAPVQFVVGGAARWVGRMVDHYIFLVGESEEAERLRGEVESLRLELGRVEEYRQENERLRRMLGLELSTDLPHLPARVVGRSATAWYRTLVLDKGLLDGVRHNAPVMTVGGLVGRVYESEAHASRVLLLTDASSVVDGIVQNSRAQVVVEGDMTPYPKLLYLGRDSDVEVGDVVVTSGLDGLFPKGIPVGQIVDLREERGEIFLAARLSPSADFSRIEEVFVLLASGSDAP